MAYKAENAIDIESRITVAAEVHMADRGDTLTPHKTLLAADETTMRAGVEGGIKEVILDRGYHSDGVLVDLDSKGFRAYVAEPKRGTRNWQRQRRRDGDQIVDERQKAYYANRRRARSETGKQLQKKRAEFPERAFAHLKRTGGLARVFVRGRREVGKKLQTHVAAANLGVILRALIGIGTPRNLQGRSKAFLKALFGVVSVLAGVILVLTGLLNRSKKYKRNSGHRWGSSQVMIAIPSRLLTASI